MTWITDFETQGSASVRQQVVSTLPYSDGFILIEGGNGCGKSSLKHSLEADLDDSCSVINLPYSRLNSEQFFSSLISHAGMPIAGMSDEQALHQLAATCLTRSRPLRLLIDDVQFMPSTTLMQLLMLGNPHNPARCAIGGVCFAPEGFGEAFSLACVSQGQPGFSLNLRIAAPTENEQRYFINQLLAQTPAVELSDEALQFLIQCAGGCLQRLKQLTGAITLEVTLNGADSPSPTTHDLALPQLRDLLNRTGLIEEDSVLLNAIAPTSLTVSATAMTSPESAALDSDILQQLPITAALTSHDEPLPGPASLAPPLTPALSANPAPLPCEQEDSGDIALTADGEHATFKHVTLEHSNLAQSNLAHSDAEYSGEESLTAASDQFVFLDDEDTVTQPETSAIPQHNELSMLPESLDPADRIALLRESSTSRPNLATDHAGPVQLTTRSGRRGAKVQSELAMLSDQPLDMEEAEPTQQDGSPTASDRCHQPCPDTLPEPPELTRLAESTVPDTQAIGAATSGKQKQSVTRLIALLLIGVAATLGTARISGYSPYSWDTLQQLAQPSSWQQRIDNTPIPRWYEASTTRLQGWIDQFNRSDWTNTNPDNNLAEHSQSAATIPVKTSGLSVMDASAPPAASIPAAIKVLEDTLRTAPNSESGAENSATAQTEPFGSQTDTINYLLALARTDEQNYRFTYPPNNNAVTRYRHVLRLAPNNSQAMAGLERIELRYQKRAKKALQQQRWEVARENYQRLLWIDDNHSWARDGLAQLPPE